MIIPLQKMILKSMTQVKRTGPISKMLKQLSLKTWRADSKTLILRTLCMEPNPRPKNLIPAGGILSSDNLQ